MNQRTKLILPAAVLVVGIASVIFGQKSSGVGANALVPNSTTTLYGVLTGAGFLLIAVSAIIVLFMIASSEDNK